MCVSVANKSGELYMDGTELSLSSWQETWQFMDILTVVGI